MSLLVAGSSTRADCLVLLRDVTARRQQKEAVSGESWRCREQIGQSLSFLWFDRDTVKIRRIGATIKMEP